MHTETNASLELGDNRLSSTQNVNVLYTKYRKNGPVYFRLEANNENVAHLEKVHIWNATEEKMKGLNNEEQVTW